MRETKTTYREFVADNYRPYSKHIVYVDYKLYCPINKKYKKSYFGFFDEDVDWTLPNYRKFLYRQLQAVAELNRCVLKDCYIRISCFTANPITFCWEVDNLGKAKENFCYSCWELEDRD